MSLSIIIPVKTPGHGKTRLAERLTHDQRAALTVAMFRRVLSAARALEPASNCYVVSRSEAIADIALGHGAHAIAELGHDHNDALMQAASLVDPDAPLLVLSADLPRVTADDLHLMRRALRWCDVVISTDHLRVGCNALLQARPGMVPFVFGTGSREKYRLAACQAGKRVTTVYSQGLASDVDVPADLASLDSELSDVIADVRLKAG